MAHDARGRRRGGTGAASTASADTLRFPLAGSAPAERGAAGIGVAADALAFPLTVAALHWLIVHVVASVAYRVGTFNAIVSPPYKVMPPPLTGFTHYLVEPMRQWDGLWYKLVAETGYVGYGAGNAKFQAAFWPLYPWLMDYGRRLTGWSTDTVGFLVSHVAFAGALILFYRLVALDFDEGVARRAVVALAFFPTAFFFSAVYTESLFLLLVVGAFLAARLGRWWVAGLVGLLAALTRSYGILLLIPFAVLFLQQNRFDLRRWFPNVVAATLPALGPAIFAYHLRTVIDDPTAFFSAQTGWDRYTSAPWDTLRCGLSGCFNINGEPDGASWTWLQTLLDRPTWATVTSQSWRLDVADSDVLELASTLLFIGLAIVGLRALPLYQSAYLIPGLVVPLFQPSNVHALYSIPRFGLTLFPLFIVLALLVRARSGAVLLAASTLLLAFFTLQFVHWYWVS